MGLYLAAFYACLLALVWKPMCVFLRRDFGGEKAGGIYIDAKDWVLFAALASFVMVSASKLRAAFCGLFPGDESTALFTYAPLYQIILIMAALAFKKLSTSEFKFGFFLNGDGFKAALKYALIALLLSFILGFVSRLGAYMITGNMPAAQEVIDIFQGAESVYVRLLAVLSFVVLAPLAEELLFRCLIYRGLKGSLPKIFAKPCQYAAAAATSAVFAAVHTNAAAFVPLFAVSMVLTALYERTGSIVVPILSHGIFNLVNVGLILLA